MLGPKIVDFVESTALDPGFRRGDGVVARRGLATKDNGARGDRQVRTALQPVIQRRRTSSSNRWLIW